MLCFSVVNKSVNRHISGISCRFEVMHCFSYFANTRNPWDMSVYTFIHHRKT